MSNVKKFIQVKKRYSVYNKHSDTYEMRFTVNVPKHEWIADVTCKGYDPQTFEIKQLNLKWFVMDKNTQHQLHVKYNKVIFKEIQTEIILELYNMNEKEFNLYGNN